MQHLHRLAFLVVALGSACFAEERFFEIPAGSGGAGMLLVTGNVQLGKAAGPKSKTIKGWSKQADTARSKDFRLEAAIVLRSLVAPPEQQSGNSGAFAPQKMRERVKLTDEEKADCRKAAIELAKSSDDIVVSQALAMMKEIGDESCCKAVALHANHMMFGQLACEILGKLRCESSIPALVRAAELNSGEYAIDAIAKIGGDKAKEALEKLSKGKLGREGTPTGEAIAKALDEIESAE